MNEKILAFNKAVAKDLEERILTPAAVLRKYLREAAGTPVYVAQAGVMYLYVQPAQLNTSPHRGNPVTYTGIPAGKHNASRRIPFTLTDVREIGYMTVQKEYHGRPIYKQYSGKS